VHDDFLPRSYYRFLSLGNLRGQAVFSFNAESIEEAEEIAKGCPIISRNIIQETMSKER
jgi:hypothetical protein